MDYARSICTWMSFVFVAGPLVVMAQFPESQTAPPQQQRERTPRPSEVADVVATVNGDPITQREVQATLEPQLQGREVDPQSVRRMQQQVVNGLVESRLIEQYVTENGPAVDQREVQALVNQIEGQLSAQEIALPEFLASRGLTKESFQKRVEGSVAWQKFQQQQLTDENLTRYFQQNRNRFTAESLDEVRQEVIDAYLGEMWTSIVNQMKSEAEVQQVAPPQVRQRPGTLPSAPK